MLRCYDCSHMNSWRYESCAHCGKSLTAGTGWKKWRLGTESIYGNFSASRESYYEAIRIEEEQEKARIDYAIALAKRIEEKKVDNKKLADEIKQKDDELQQRINTEVALIVEGEKKKMYNDMMMIIKAEVQKELDNIKGAKRLVSIEGIEGVPDIVLSVEGLART